MGTLRAKHMLLNGKFVGYEEAKIHVLTPAVKYGATVYEGMRGYYVQEQNEVYLFRLDDHLIRLFQSMELAWMNPPFGASEFRRQIIELIKKNEYREDIHIRIMVFIQSDDGGMTFLGSRGLCDRRLAHGSNLEQSRNGPSLQSEFLA